MEKGLFQDDVAGVDRTDRSYQRKIMAERRALERDITLDLSRKDARRRGRCRKHPGRFCRVYFPKIFYHPFTADQKVMIKAIHDRIIYGAWQATAAERGGGKSSIAKIVGGVWTADDRSVGIKPLVPLAGNEDRGRGIADAAVVILNQVGEALDKYPDKIEEYHKGKKGLLGLFMGEVMKLSGGKADPAIANRMILEELQNRKQ